MHGEERKEMGSVTFASVFPPCSNASMKARLVSAVQCEMSIATYPTSPRIQFESGL